MTSQVVRTRIAFLLMAISCGSAGAIETQAIDIDSFIHWQNNAEIGTGEERKLPDALKASAGVAVYTSLNNQPQGFYVRPGILFSLSKEEVYEGVARASVDERLSAWNTLGFMIDPHFGYAWKAEKIEMGVQLGPSFNIRVPLSGGRGNKADIWKAFYEKSRFLYGGLVFWTGIRLSEQVSVLLGGRMYYPLSNIWTEAPILHGIQAGVNISLRFWLNRSDSAAP